VPGGHCFGNNSSLSLPPSLSLSLSVSLSFHWHWSLNSGHHTCKAGVLPLEPNQSTLLWLFWRKSLANYLSGLTLNCDPPNLCLPSSWYYRSEPLAPGFPCLLYLLQVINLSSFFYVMFWHWIHQDVNLLHWVTE
jgi:hypothetical protein